jgi:hypothetical protein
VLYYTKGSGGNGVDTATFLDTTGKACPNAVGLPEPGAALPTTSIAGTYSRHVHDGRPAEVGLRRLGR